jgi:hypothetical protein
LVKPAGFVQAPVASSPAPVSAPAMPRLRAPGFEKLNSIAFGPEAASTCASAFRSPTASNATIANPAPRTTLLELGTPTSADMGAPSAPRRLNNAEQARGEHLGVESEAPGDAVPAVPIEETAEGGKRAQPGGGGGTGGVG